MVKRLFAKRIFKKSQCRAKGPKENLKRKRRLPSSTLTRIQNLALPAGQNKMRTLLGKMSAALVGLNGGKKFVPVLGRMIPSVEQVMMSVSRRLSIP